jgi:hypothetical protein
MDTFAKTQLIARFYRSRGDHYTADRVLDCRRGDRCKERHCPVCEWNKARQRFETLTSAHGQLLSQYPRMRPPLIVTLTTSNTPVGSIGAAVRELSSTTTRAFSSVGSTYGWYRQLEITPACVGTSHANVHAHACLFLPQRQDITAERLYGTWAEVITSTARVIAPRVIKLGPPEESLERALRYSTKAEELDKLLHDPDTGQFEPSFCFFEAYSRQTARKHMHRFHNLLASPHDT